MATSYDLIGDIHGHADELIKLLEHLGYRESDTGYQHDSNKIIFLGDFIDRGEELRQHRKLLDTVMPMVNNGHALAVMGNHEFNALAFHTQHKGEPLREHSDKNRGQHKAFLNEYGDQQDLKEEVLHFFYRLPLWLELDGLRVVHACWDDNHIATLKSKTNGNLLTEDLLIEASAKGTETYHAIETILKGVEVKLSDGITFKDKDNNIRDAVRVQWWKNNASTLGEVALPHRVDIGTAAHLTIPEYVPKYSANWPPCFIGHYWWGGDPKPLTDNVACLDYSVVKPDGKLVAYRWNGEQILKRENFTHVK